MWQAVRTLVSQPTKHRCRAARLRDAIEKSANTVSSSEREAMDSSTCRMHIKDCGAPH